MLSFSTQFLNAFVKCDKVFSLECVSHLICFHPLDVHYRRLSIFSLLALWLFVLLLLPLLMFQFLRWILHKLARIVNACPFWLAIVNVQDTAWIEHVTAATQRQRLRGALGPACAEVELIEIWRDKLERAEGAAHLTSKFFLSSSLNSSNVGNSRIIFLPSSIMGVRQYAQLTLQGSLCTHVLLLLSYQPKSWCPCVKLISSLWKMAHHWNGAPMCCTCQSFAS